MNTLPLYLQPEARFDCHRCGVCCRSDLGVLLEPGDRENLELHDWSEEGVRFEAGFLRPSPEPTEPSRLRVEDGACVFLDDDNSCLVHMRLGGSEKPVRCQAFPFRFAAMPVAIQMSVSTECASLHRSFDCGTLIEESKELIELSEAVPRLLIVGEQFVLRYGEPPRLSWDDVYAGLEDVAGAAASATPFEDLPWAVARAVRRYLDGPAPPTPWEYEGPPQVPFYQCLDHLGDLLVPIAGSLGLSRLESAFAAMRRWMVWRGAARSLEPLAEAFLRFQLRSLTYELRPLQLGQLAGGVGSALYLVMATAVGAARAGQVQRAGAVGNAAEANAVAREASAFYGSPAALALMEENLLVFERLIFDAPRPGP
ncbi:YkgJ family cysteine cluster protein [Planctomycetota bacterium]